MKQSSVPHANRKKERSPWTFIPTLYFAEGIPNVVVAVVSVIMFKRLGVSNTDIALYTSWLYLPWVIKPLWSPLVDILNSKRFWIVTMQLIIGAGLGGVALTIPLPSFFQYTLLCFWLLAFSSATHDIAADGFYMLSLTKHQQTWYVGVRSTFYRLAMITGQGLLIVLAGYIESTSGLDTVNIDVHAKIGQQNVGFIHPDSIKVEQSEGELKIIPYPEDLEIAALPLHKAKADSILAFAQKWNIENGFYSTRKNNQVQSIKTEKPSWWQRVVVSRLELFLKTNFGSKKSTTDNFEVGNIGVLYFSLSRQPEAEQQIVVNFGRESGDKSIALIEGSRFVFDHNNWNKSFIAVIQLDPKLQQNSFAAFQAKAGNIPLAWSITFIVLAAMFIFFAVYHKFILPYPAADTESTRQEKGFVNEFFKTFVSFFKKKNIGSILAFLFFYRFAEAQLAKLAPPFLLDAHEVGGLALTTGQIGFVYGTIGLIALTLGGLLGGFLAARNGLKYWLWWMVIAINVPDLVYAYLAYALPENLFTIHVCVAIEQFGYGFGFTAYMLYMIHVSEGEHKTAHYAICTGLMALGLMLPGMFSGWLQETIGYQSFFVWVMISTIPPFIVSKFIQVDPEFGKR